MVGGANAMLNNFMFGPASQGTSDLIQNFRPGTDMLTLTSGVTINTQTLTTAGLSVQLSDGSTLTFSELTGNLTGSLTNNGSLWS